MNKTWIAVLIGILLAFMLARGLKQKEVPPVIETQKPSELPELEQNKIYMTNHPVEIPEPTQKFEEAPDDLKKISDDEAKLISPLKD